MPGLRRKEDLEASSHNIKCEPLRDLPGGPVVKTLSFQCRGCGLDSG